MDEQLERMKQSKLFQKLLEALPKPYPVYA